MKLKDICEGITVYRGVTHKNLPKRYPGTYYTENPDLAKRYAKQEGTVHTKIIDPVNPLVIDRLLDDAEFRKDLEANLVAFMRKHHPTVDLEDTQLYDNMTSGITDFSYPTIYDNQFLKSMGYDSVKFSYEGGERVDSWYIMD